MDYSELLAHSTRTDSYVNATKLATAFGKRLDNWFANADTKAYLATLESQGYEYKHSVRGKGTYLHPLAAIKLAEWLSPEFEVAVKTVFKQYLDGDADLAINIIERQTNVNDSKRIEARAIGKAARLEFTTELKERGVKGIGYALNTNAVYDGVFGLDAEELKGRLQAKNPRDAMSELELTAIKFAELKAVAKMKEVGAVGNSQTVRCSRAAAILVGQALLG